MIYLKKSKELLNNESYVLGKENNKQVLIPLHEFDEVVGFCPECGKLTTVDSEMIYMAMKNMYDEEEDLENICYLNVSCAKCSTKRYMDKLKSENIRQDRG